MTDLLAEIRRHQKDPPRSRVMPIELPNVDRTDLAALFHAMGFKEGAEIGVEAGVYAEVICQANPGVRLHCVDSWVGYRGYKEGDVNMEKNHADAVRRLKPYDCKLWAMTSVEAAEHFPDKSLDFVYLDANHDLPHVIEDIRAWLPKVKIGGVIAGHDYRKIRRFKVRGKAVRNESHHVVEAVQAWTAAYDIRPWFVFGRKEKIEGEKRDKNRSWMWIRSF